MLYQTGKIHSAHSATLHPYKTQLFSQGTLDRQNGEEPSFRRLFNGYIIEDHLLQGYIIINPNRTLRPFQRMNHNYNSAEQLRIQQKDPTVPHGRTLSP